MKIIWTFTLMMIPGVMSSISVTGYSGGEVTIKCRYDEKYTSNSKYFCKGWNSRCSDLIKTEKKDKWFHYKRLSLYDNTSAAVFTVIIRNLSEQDSGTYQCAVDISLSRDSYTEVKLTVISDLPKTTSTLLPSTPSSSSSSSVFKTSSSNLLKGSSLIIFLALVLLVLIIVGVLLLFLYKKHQSQGGDLSSQAGAGKQELVSHTGCDYEDIKDTQKLPTNPADSSNTVYATAELPKNPCVSSDSVYSTVHKPTGDSQTLVTYSEDLNYAVVNFQKKADCSDRNNQDYCEYVAVNHHTA